jgi:hypothetical protein
MNEAVSPTIQRWVGCLSAPCTRIEIDTDFSFLRRIAFRFAHGSGVSI